MNASQQLVIGRAADCDIVVDHASVSGHHARLRWEGVTLVLEDLGSANGTWLEGERVERAMVRPGADVRLADVPLPWADSRLGAFLRRGRPGDTMLALPRFGRYVCPQCQKRGILPPGFRQGELACPHCGTLLAFGERARTGWVAPLAALAPVALAAFAVVFVAVSPARRAWLSGVLGQPGATASMPAAGASAPSLTPQGPTSEEERIRLTILPKVLAAIDPSSPATRDLAVQVAAEDQGPFHVEQVAGIWSYVRVRFNYVNDPRGTEYFAKASETIANGFAGDCDDFATTLAAMLESIGGRTRVVIMDGRDGGHAYTEVCVDDDPQDIADRLTRYYRRHWDRRLGPRPPPHGVSYRSDARCPAWVNLDWSANVVGGPYGEERWAVAIYTDGHTETLPPSGGTASAITPPPTTATPPPPQ